MEDAIRMPVNVLTTPVSIRCLRGAEDVHRLEPHRRQNLRIRELQQSKQAKRYSSQHLWERTMFTQRLTWPGY